MRYDELRFTSLIFIARFDGHESRRGFHKIVETGLRALWTGSRHRINPDETVAC